MIPDTPADRQTQAQRARKRKALGRVRGIWRHSDVDWNEVARLADSLTLSEHRARRLYLQLCRARDNFDGRGEIESKPKNSAVARRLDRIEQSIKRIADEARSVDALFDEAKSVLASEGERWAAQHQLTDLLSLGFCPRQLGSGTLYGASTVIERWFQMAPVIHEVVRQARRGLKVQPDLASHWVDEPGPREWLCGKRLPELYEQFSGARFHIPKTSTREIKKSDGIAFIIHALTAMGLDSTEPETVASQWKSIRRRNAKLARPTG